MPFVLDACVVIAWALDDEFHPLALTALERSRREEVFVPGLWWYEVRNALVINERRARLTESATAIFLRDLSRLSITIDFHHDEARVLAISRRHKLTVYDSAYLELAEREDLPLATLDEKLRRAARSEKVPLVDASAV